MMTMIQDSNSKSLLAEMRDRFPRQFKQVYNALFIHTDLSGFTTIEVPDSKVRAELPRTITLFKLSYSRCNDGIYRLKSRVQIKDGQTHISGRAITFMINIVHDGSPVATFHHLQTPFMGSDKDIVHALMNSDYGSSGMLQALKHGTLTVERSADCKTVQLSENSSTTVPLKVTIEHKNKVIVLTLSNINDY